MKQVAWVLLSLALLTGLVLLSDPPRLLAAITQADPVYLLLGVAVWLVELGIRTLRWQYLLRCTDIKTAFGPTLRVYAAGLFLANLTPARTGDPVRSVLLKRETGTPFTKSLPSIVFERIIDTIVLLVLAGVGLTLLADRLPALAPWVLPTMVVYVGLILGAIYVTSSERRITRLVGAIVRVLSFVPFVNRRADRVGEGSRNLAALFRRFRSPGTIAVAAVGALIVWVLEGITVLLGFLALGLHADPLLVVAATAIAILLSTPATLPGGFGSPEVVITLVFLGALSFEVPLTTAAVLLARLMSFGVAAIVGGIALAGGFPRRATE